jgi:molybdate transport repressor ModE-like protein
VHHEAGRHGSIPAWSALELRQLAALQAVAREGSFDAAARVLDETDRAVSAQIAALERIVGDRLVERELGTKRPRLTPVGRVVLFHADAMLAQARVAASEVGSRPATSGQTVRLAIAEDAAPFLLPRLLARLGDKKITLDVCNVGAVQATAWVQEGRVDVAIAPAPPEAGELVVRDLLDDPYVLVLRSDADEPAELGACTFVEPVTPDPAYWATLVETGLEKRRVAGRADRITLVLQLVAAGVGVALLPKACVGDDSPLRTVPVAGAPSRKLSAFWLRSRLLSPAALWLVAAAEALARELKQAAAEEGPDAGGGAALATQRRPG